MAGGPEGCRPGGRPAVTDPCAPDSGHFRTALGAAGEVRDHGPVPFASQPRAAPAPPAGTCLRSTAFAPAFRTLARHLSKACVPAFRILAMHLPRSRRASPEAQESAYAQAPPWAFVVVVRRIASRACSEAVPGSIPRVGVRGLPGRASFAAMAEQPAQRKRGKRGGAPWVPPWALGAAAGAPVNNFYFHNVEVFQQALNPFARSRCTSVLASTCLRMQH